jgi:hypothetical protein
MTHETMSAESRRGQTVDSDDCRAAPSEVVPQLQRWELFGGVWRVVGRSNDRVDIALLRCDGGEVVERIDARFDPALEAFLAGRTSSE